MECWSDGLIDEIVLDGVMGELGVVVHIHFFEDT